MGRCVQTFNWSCFCFLVNTNQNIMESEIIWFSNVLPFAVRMYRALPPLKARRVVGVNSWLKRATASHLQTSFKKTCLPVPISSISAASLCAVFNVASLQWCPPCRALLPELRKASIQLAGQMKFGTIDCTIHHNLCSTVRTPVEILTFSLDRNIRQSREELVLQCNDFLVILDLQIGQKCDINQRQILICLSFYLLFLSFSTTSRPIRRRSSLTAPRCTNMKGTTRLTASSSSYRYRHHSCFFW